MPGPKMGPRPADFDEEIVRQSPTFLKWQTLEEGERLRYACREFVRGHGDDEERLMRRIMIARRNNLRDHETLKKARAATTLDDDGILLGEHNTAVTIQQQQQQQQRQLQRQQSQKERKPAKRRKTSATVDDQVVKEMDVGAVERTRSYRAWLGLEDGKEFVYNQKYIKGKPTHDWLLRKNIWRRMRYRRENKKMVQALAGDEDDDEDNTGTTADGLHVVKSEMISSDQADTDAANSVAAGIVDDALLASAAAAADKVDIHKSVVEAAVAAAESYVKSQENENKEVEDVVTV
mmetsp:Transcript_17689/g.29261  ORF Transcript_17689/g.29261 Transcript_17689/m.29261 type:complete len:292 (+) Transcript_17689:98-973(+)|eukprot:CAMPEP_0119021614 /NCGR_PEP_ID=MMETSP1176-20130426/26341_1 /TAXON_ID=265551 /ORGANISM="Synedropsis recta cf, Strain CCMP1620" /LENGTH=291 /DNA_ID=CAMNT_0006976257 /DNA_START=72 /DNA_END=947 /DNA_ORIENTATION=-